MRDTHRSLAELLSPPDQQDDFTRWMLDQEGGTFMGAKRLPDGTYAGVLRLAFTVSICLGVTADRPFTRRYCYAHPLLNCLWAYDKLTSGEDVPTGWKSSRPKTQLKEWTSIDIAPLDGTILDVAQFDQFGVCNWCRSAAYEGGWMEVDSPSAGQMLEGVTHFRLPRE